MKLIKSTTVILLLTVFLISQAQAATVHGTVYSWSDFEKPLRNAIIEVNSTPAQSIVSNDGSFSFDLFPGNYSIKAKYYRNNALELMNEEDIIIDKDGNFTLDILLFPPTDLENDFLADLNLTNISIRNEDEVNSENIIFYLTILLLLVLLIAGMLWLMKMRARSNVEMPKNEIGPEFNETSPEKQIDSPPANLPDSFPMNLSKPQDKAEELKNRKLPDDLQSLYEAIIQSGGRVTQKDLRKKFTCSEAKVSLMLADLEDRGLIKKIKRGRANIIIAEPPK